MSPVSKSSLLLLATALLSSGLLLPVRAEEANQQAAGEQTTTTAPQTATGSTSSPSESASTTIVIETGVKSTSAPASTSGAETTTQMPAATVEQLIRILSSEHADPSEPLHNFCDYLKPICTTLDKLTEKCLAMTSSQMKKFSHLSPDNKLSQCFQEAYNFDPAKSNVTKQELGQICASKDLPADVKNSYKSFQKCAQKHWSANIDREIDRIQVARLEYLRANQHLKDSTTSMLAQGDEEEAKVVSEIVERVLGGEPGKAAAASDVKVLNFDSGSSQAKVSSSTTSAPATVIVHHSAASAAPAAGSGSGSHPAPTGKSHAANGTSAAAKQDKALLADPNTLVVFVDVAKNATTTKKPEQHHSSGKPTGSSISLVKVIEKSPATSPKPSSETSTTSSSPAASGADSDASEGSSTAKPTGGESSSTAKPDESATGSGGEEASTTAKPSASTSAKPADGKEASTTASPVLQKATELLKKSLNETLHSTSSTTATPKEKTSEEKMEAKEVQLEGKLKEEREMMLKLLRKNQDELEALNAMKALSAQRQRSVAQHDHSDERVHQMEHHRQMAIDPIAHMIKHQQYEVKKKLSGR